MKKILLLALPCLLSIIANSQETFYWMSGANSGDWSGGNARWFKVSNSAGYFGCPDATSILRFDNNNQSTMNNNCSSDFAIHQMFFMTGTTARTFSGNSVRFYDWGGADPKIENNSSNIKHTFNFNVSGDGDVGDPLEINPVDGDFDFNGTINNMGSDIKVYGNNSKTLTINGVLSGSGALQILQNSTVLITSTSTYTGLTTITAGTLRLNKSGGGTILSTNNITVNGGTLRISSDQTINNLTVSSGTLQIDAGVTLTINGTFTGGGTITNSGKIVIASNQSFPGATTTITSGFKDLGINANVTLNKQLDVYGIVSFGSVNSKTLTTGANLTLKSDASGTARFADITNSGANTGNAISGNVAVERYVPSKSARKWSYVASPVTVSTIRSGWQDDVFISGAGTGGTTCGSTTGDGTVSTDKYNTNGFDVTPSNTASMYIYNATQVSGSRWVSVSNTNATALTPGIGYRLNLRGSRGAADANCADQLNSLSPSTPAALTLSATGTLAQGDVAVNLNAPATHLYTLIGNPYASELSFTAFQSDATSNGGGGSNSANISNKFWAFSSQSSTNNFATYSSGISTNFPAANSNPPIIASGQAFFVEASSSGASGNVIFRESHKSSTTQNGNTMFRTNSWAERIRVKFSDVTNNHIDEAVIRFGNDPLITTGENVFDAVTFNSGTYLSTRKATKGFAIQTRPLAFTSDTVSLTVASTTNGNYQLNFSEFQDLVTAPVIQLIDSYTNTVTNVRTQTTYAFTIDANAASQGDNRFKLVFRNTSALPVRSIDLSAEQKSETVQLNWSVIAEYDVLNYAVEKSNDGRNFRTIGSVAALNSSNTANYSFIDKEPSTQVSFYRIRINNKNGGTGYSSIIKMQNGKSVTLYLYPNPIKDELNIILNSGGNNRYELRLTNMFGQTVYTSNQTANNGAIKVNTKGIAPGAYVVQLVSTKGEIITETFIKQ